MDQKAEGSREPSEMQVAQAAIRGNPESSLLELCQDGTGKAQSTVSPARRSWVGNAGGRKLDLEMNLLHLQNKSLSQTLPAAGLGQSFQTGKTSRKI